MPGTDGPITRHLTVYNVLGVEFIIPKRYVLLDLIGRGAYGTVCAARDDLTGENVAIKKISGVFDHVVFSKRCVREIRIMRVLEHENLLGVMNIMEGEPSSEGGLDFNDIYIVSNLMETDLSSVIKSPQALTGQHLQFFTYQILKGLSYLHASNIVHRDLKPRNLLCNSNCDLTICDFGLARISFPHLMHRVSSMTDYVATRWYRAPEIIIGWAEYGKAVDVWGVGCILAELVLRRPIFAGSNNEEQLRLITSILGCPSEDTIAKVEKLHYRELLQEINEQGNSKRSRLETFFRQHGASEDCIEVLKYALTFDPDERSTCNQLLRLPYFSEMTEDDEDMDGDDEEGIDLPYEDFAFEDMPCTHDVMKREIIKEVIWNQERDKETLAEQGLVDVEAKDWASEDMPEMLQLPTLEELRGMYSDGNSESSPTSGGQLRGRLHSDISLDDEFLYANTNSRDANRRSFSLQEFKEELTKTAGEMEEMRTAVDETMADLDLDIDDGDKKGGGDDKKPEAK
ncbi:hypothetical protein TL16_g08187 [Triparma laevis f. inornata]|uniref:Mitogen-activated protein kinase n=2 Tax=Triparma laevis TaxID=1534972 RepID=A0A9W7FJI1_9STRA|nr:hypothetical protein TL16_g08187 [Triparma laevis f. inornata]GMI13644.1 hypothetical protein TrLO_g8566 [Triparma laevis f. longispina]